MAAECLSRVGRTGADFRAAGGRSSQPTGSGSRDSDLCLLHHWSWQVSPARLHRGCPVPLACGAAQPRPGPRLHGSGSGLPKASRLHYRGLDLGERLTKSRAVGFRTPGRQRGQTPLVPKRTFSQSRPGCRGHTRSRQAHMTPLCPGLCLGVSGARAPGAERPAAGWLLSASQCRLTC